MTAVPSARQGVVAVLGIFARDITCLAPRQPKMGETLLADGVYEGPGGKGSNQAVAAGRLGAKARLITRLGRDAGAALARATWAEAGVEPFVTESATQPTGSALILVERETGRNAIAVHPGAAAELSPADVEAHAGAIEGAAAFLTQLEQPLPAARRALEIARAAGTATILNPAPAAHLPAELLALCDHLTPNEPEAEALTGLSVASEEDARAAARALRAMGVGTVVLTMGGRGALLCDASGEHRLPALGRGPVVDTVGAGDVFAGAYATALAEGRSPREAVRFANAAAGISVTRPGAAASAPWRAEVEEALAGAS
ncbi:ribokinase [Albimonas sp. CAU 1670]|uniref:ribokinase n=1 Tax=Albimonas sp. CAU 1670 TaxID=3032599 RepID=UPI0023DBBC3A|nr:ribokinase [Albimonas sp. CAU 1670]MDF2234138.1 ribokinase [Albimonas sp. CAU 1670]